MASSRRTTQKESKRKYAIQVSRKSDGVLVEDGAQVVNKYFDEPNVMISSDVSIVYVMNVSLIVVNINMVKSSINCEKRELHNVSV